MAASWLFPSIILTCMMSGVLTIVHLYLWFERRYRYLLFWTVSWSLHTLRYLSDILGILYQDLGIFNVLVDGAAVLSGLFLLIGAFRFVRKPRGSEPVIILLSSTALLWSFAANYIYGKPVIGALPGFIFLGAAYIFLGASFIIKNEGLSYKSGQMLGIIFILWGIHKFNYPLLRGYASIAIFGYLLGMAFSMTTAVYMIIFTLDEVCRERDNSVRRLQLLNDNVMDIIIFTYSDGRIIEANKATADAYGYDQRTLAGMSLSDLQSPEMRTTAIRQMKEALARDISYQTTHVRRNGERFPVEIAVRCMLIERDEICFNIIRDISEIKRSEEALTAERERLRITLRSIGDGVISADAEGKVTLINRAAEEITGWRQEEALGKEMSKIFRIVNPGSGEPHKNPAEEALRSGKVITLSEDVYLIAKDGTRRYITDDCAPICDENGNINGVMLVFKDVTEKRRFEEKIRFLHFHDSLTGLYNRAYFEEELSRLDTERQLPLSLIVGDVNGLKLVNDTFGHNEGDRILRSIADIFKSCCRKEDIVARWGGDEFAILLPRTNQKVVAEICERIKKSCMHTPNEKIQPTVSLGYATKETPSQDIAWVVKEVEERMYRSKLRESSSARHSMISSLERSLWETDYETEEHAKRIQELTLKMGKAMNLSSNQLDELALLSALHDIGKIAIPSNILKKIDELTKDEWETLKKHPEIGYRIAISSPDLAPIAEAILSHHERWDGRGYPQRLKGEEIPLIARIVAIADSYDVMTHGRPYKIAISPKAALEEIRQCAGTQFDPKLVEIFIDMLSTESEERILTGL